MPAGLFNIAYVESERTHRGEHDYRYTVCTTTDLEPLPERPCVVGYGKRVLWTFDLDIAELCREACEKRRAIRLIWMDTEHGPSLRAAYVTKAEVAA